MYYNILYTWSEELVQYDDIQLLMLDARPSLLEIDKKGPAYSPNVAMVNCKMTLEID